MASEVNVCWIQGNHRDRQKTIDKIKTVLGDCSVSIYDNEVSFEFLQTEIRELSCFSEKRLLIINACPIIKVTKTKFYKQFIEVLEKAPKDCVIILNNLDIESEAFIKSVGKIGKIFKFEQDIPREQVKAWITRKIAENDKNIEEKDAITLVDSFGPDAKTISVDKLNLLIDRLVAFVGNNKNIKHEDVMKIGVDSSDFVVWSLFTLLDNKDYCSAIRLIARSFAKEKKISEAVKNLLNLMLWRYKLLLLVKEILNTETDEQKLLEKMRLFIKLKHEGSNSKITFEQEFQKDGKPKPMYSDGMIKTLIYGNYKNKPPVMCYKRASLFRIVESIDSILIKIRVGITEAEAELLLDTILMLICEKVDYKNIKNLWSDQK